VLSQAEEREEVTGVSHRSRSLCRAAVGWSPERCRRLRRCTAPAVEVSDTPEAVVVKAQVPGIKKEDLQVNITENTITLKGETKEEEQIQT
jgi:HSP20 family molecular chaperone IbpA